MRLPNHTFSTSLTDFDQLAGFFTGWNGRFEQLSAGRFEGRLSVAHGRTVRLESVDCNQVILARGRGEPGMFSIYIVTPANAGGLWQGRRLTPGQLVVQGPEAETNHITARRITSVGYTLRAGDAEAAARSLLGNEFEGLPISWAALTPPPELYRELNAQFHRLLALALNDPTILTSAEGSQLEQEAIRAVVKSVVPAGSPFLGISAPQRVVVVRRAEELMRSRLHEPLGIVDLCGRLGVSARTLRRAFLERFGLGPMTYYRRIRLNATRTALKGGSPHGVAEVARRFGFHHLGNFAADYRRLFSERPSETRASG